MTTKRRKRNWKLWLAVGLGVLVLGVAAGYWKTRLQPDPNELAVGTPAPQVNLLRTDGKPFSLADVEGFPVLVFYRGHW
ncbi:MAG: hypothetical protein ACYS22_02900 [Planctomycetota bacterium]|jgi:cytochrome oxidase Cu insertion factor (SCO1/SenC/PrrC family)